MTFDSIILAAVVDELNKKLAGGRIRDIHQPSPLDVVLTIRQQGTNYMLLISAEAQSPRVHLTASRRPNPKFPPNFCMVLRKYLEGARFASAEQVGFDRILHLSFDAYDGERLTLVVEIMGKHSNIVLISGAHRILGAVKHIGRSKNRYREILPGREYVYPPSQNKVNPLLVTKEQFDKLLSETFQGGDWAEWLVNTFAGVSPFAAREIVKRASGEAAALIEVFIELFTDIRLGNFLPVIITDDVGQTIGYYAFPTVQYPEQNQHERTSISLVADAYYTSVLPKRAFEQAKEAFFAQLRKELQAREQAVSAIQESLEECKQAERYKQIGELILAQLPSIPREVSSVELVDYYDPATPKITVELDPSLSPAENAEVYFRRYQKSVSGAEALQDRLREVEGEIRILKKMLSSANSVTTQEQIDSLVQILESQGIYLRKQQSPPSEKQREEFEGHRILKVNSNGWEILVGQDSEANDYLLTRVARSTDYWVHVKASPSAHVIIRTNGKPDSVPKSVLMEAAELAVQHSDSRYSSLVPVDYTLRKYVRKPKGAPPGKVIYHNEKTIFVTSRL